MKRREKEKKKERRSSSGGEKAATPHLSKNVYRSGKVWDSGNQPEGAVSHGAASVGPPLGRESHKGPVYIRVRSFTTPFLHLSNFVKVVVPPPPPLLFRSQGAPSSFSSSSTLDT